MANRPRSRIILFAQTRSGSTSLYRVLQSHPHLNLALEPFHDRSAEYNPGQKNYVDLIHDVASLDRALDDLFAKQTKVWQISDMNDEAERMYHSLEPFPLQKLADGLEYGHHLEKRFTNVLRRRPPGTYLELWYERLYTSDVTANRAAAGEIFRFLGLDIPDLEEVDHHLDSRCSKINSVERYALAPNAPEINERFGSDDTGWLLEVTS